MSDDKQPNAIIPAGSMPANKYDEDAFKNVIKSGDYLPRLQLMTANSDKCTDGSFPANHYALIKDQDYEDLGEQTDVAIVDWRPKAIEFGDEITITVYDPNHTDFERIVTKAKDKAKGVMYGVEFLIFLAEKKEFAIFFMGTKSSRREAPKVKALMHQAATLKAKKIQTKKYVYFNPAVTSCSTPFDPPDPTELATVVEKFVNPPEPTVETAPETEGEERAR